MVALVLAVFLSGCGGGYHAPIRPTPASLPPEKRLQRMGYTIQVGAFAVAENAARFSDKLFGQGLDAIYFRAEDGLFKVRFGDFAAKEDARKEAERLRHPESSKYFILSAPANMPWTGKLAWETLICGMNW